MEWDRDKSLLLSRVCVWLFAGALAALCAGAPWLWPWLVGRPEGAAWYMAVTYITAVPAAVVLYGLHRLLQNLSAGKVFIAGNVRWLRVLSWCCIAAGLVYLAGALAGNLVLWVLAAAAAFVGLMLRVVKNVFAQAVALKEENDYTI